MTARKTDKRDDLVRLLPNGAVRCSGHVPNGNQCRKAAIKGGTVCRSHGGGAPQVKRKAAIRLLELVDPAIATLAREMTTATRSSDRQSAANSILDRAGHGRTTKVEDDSTELLLAMIRGERAS